MAQRVYIIGAGVVGLATACALVREGFDMTLVEAHGRGGLETSYANGGQLSYRYAASLADSGVPAQMFSQLLRNDTPLRLRPRLDPAQWRRLLGFLAACRGSLNRRNAAHLLRLALLSQHTLQAWCEKDGLDGLNWWRSGKLVAFRQPASFARTRQGLADHSVQFVLSAAECRELESALSAAPFAGGIHTPDEGVADCYVFCVQLAERLQASRHCRQLHGRRVMKIVEGGAAVRGVEVGGDLIEADHVVLVAGYRSAELMLPGLRLPLYLLKGYSLTLPAGAQHRVPDTSITDYDRKVIYARVGERLRITATVDTVDFDPGLEPVRLTLLHQQARDTFPQGGDFDAAVEWAGMRPATPIGVPLVGSGDYRNLWLSLGRGALGFTLACGSGRLLAEQIGRRPPSIDTTGLLPHGALAG